MVIPFAECIARPAEGGYPPQPLGDHLACVANAWAAVSKHSTAIAAPNGQSGARRIQREGTDSAGVASQDELGDLRKKLLLLGGLLHDAGKARTSWQYYIRNSERSRRGSVFHSPMGSFLFFYASRRLLDCLAETPCVSRAVSSLEASMLRAWITLDIEGHHGAIRDVAELPPWVQSFDPDQLDETDTEGLFRFVEGCMNLPEMRLNAEEAATYYNGASAWEWRRLATIPFSRRRQEILKSDNKYALAARCCLQTRTSGLITADRLDAARMEESCLLPAAARVAIDRVGDFIREKATKALSEGASAQIVKMRNDAQAFAISAYGDRPNEGIYRLNLPTGYGKTIAALRVALVSCAQGVSRRIVHVAPYLAILSEATRDIRNATGLDVLQHHHLSVMNTPDKSADSSPHATPPIDPSAQKRDGEPDDRYILTLESWRAPAITTTFNQLFLALFPGRAQQTMRLSALKNAFIVVDEPQIIEPSKWKLFLVMIEALVYEQECQVLFTTATMPPVFGGLSKAPYSLTMDDIQPVPRYEIMPEPSVLDADMLTTKVLAELSGHKHLAVVLNTVGNAAKLFDKISQKVQHCRERYGKVRCYHLSGAMISLHKAHAVDAIRKALESPEPVIVISTQVLEAGVDLSFDLIYREMPIFPSIVQVAGRANRHGEQSALAQVRVFRFVDENGKEPRIYVYRAGIWRDETDSIIERHARGWSEDQTAGLLDEFFEACYRRSPGETFFESLMEGAVGRGTSLRNMQPFEGPQGRIDVFVPRDDWTTEPVRGVMGSFGASSAADIYSRYLEPGFVPGLAFAQRKRFFALMQHFTVSTRYETARNIADWDGRCVIWRLNNADSYDLNKGLAGAGISDFSYGEM